MAKKARRARGQDGLAWKHPWLSPLLALAETPEPSAVAIATPRQVAPGVLGVLTTLTPNRFPPTGFKNGINLHLPTEISPQTTLFRIHHEETNQCRRDTSGFLSPLTG